MKTHEDNKLTPKDFDFSKMYRPPEPRPFIRGRIEIDELLKGSEYVKQLESRLAQVERERDAAVMDIGEASYFQCRVCKHNSWPVCKKGCHNLVEDDICDCKFFEWRGVCAENTEEG